jgi:hypothetical protein
MYPVRYEDACALRVLRESEKLQDRDAKGEAYSRAGYNSDESLAGASAKNHVDDQTEQWENYDERREIEEALCFAKYGAPP